MSIAVLLLVSSLMHQVITVQPHDDKQWNVNQQEFMS